MWGPFARLGGVLWLEVSGVFFGIFALFALGAVIRLRGQWHAGSAERQQLAGAAAMLALFGYFCVSTSVRAGGGNGGDDGKHSAVRALAALLAMWRWAQQSDAAGSFRLD